MFKKAVLLVHGFAGSTYDLEKLAQFLQLDNKFDVFSYTLPGHADNLFMNIEYTKWIEKSDEMMNFLISHNYHTIYVIGHSMGGVIATYLASKYKQIKKLVLLAPAFITFYDSKDKLAHNLAKGKMIIDDHGYKEVIGRVLKSSVKGAKEFLKLIEKYHDVPSKVEVPTLIIQGLSDSIVTKDSSEYVYKNLKGKKELVYMSDINHDVLNNTRTDEVIKIIYQFLKRIVPVSGVRKM